MPLRTHQAAVALDLIKDASAFNVPGCLYRRKLNQHATLYQFTDGSFLQISATKSRADAWHPGWTGSANDIHLGPVKGVPLRINRQGV